MTTYHSNAFGRPYATQREGDAWQASSIGTDGKCGPAGFVVPGFIEPDELGQYLSTSFHENATPTNGEVRRIDR